MGNLTKSYGKNLIVLLSVWCAFWSVSASAQVTAFPGAEGYGAYATGGRGGRVMIVANLDDEGPGSFREAAEAKGKRIIVFAVSGTIHLTKKLSIRGDVTIAGQTAPGDGICLADESVGLGGDNIIVRYLRFRMGDRNQKGGMVDGNGADDAFGGTRRKLIMIDHCSLSWSTDEVLSVYGGDSTTMQWNLIAEPLNYSYHFESGDKDYERHGYGGIWGGRHLSAHHNLFAHCNSRNPRFNGIRTGEETEFVDYRNNVIFDWGGNSAYGGEGGTYNLVNNYYRYGPSTSKKTRSRVVNPTRTEKIGFGKFYVQGNFVFEDPKVSDDNWLGVDMGNGGTEEDKRNALVRAPFPAAPVATQKARQAYKLVLQQVGASYRRDTLDQRIIREVTAGKGRLIDVQGGFPHGTAYEATVQAWPALRQLAAPVDTDKDGMPDEWERKKGLDPNNPADASTNTLDPGYTNIEMYINSIVL